MTGSSASPPPTPKANKQASEQRRKEEKEWHYADGCWCCGSEQVAQYIAMRSWLSSEATERQVLKYEIYDGQYDASCYVRGRKGKGKGKGDKNNAPSKHARRRPCPEGWLVPGGAWGHIVEGAVGVGTEGCRPEGRRVVVPSRPQPWTGRSVGRLLVLGQVGLGI